MSAPMEPSFVPATKKEKPALKSLRRGRGVASSGVGSVDACGGIEGAFSVESASSGCLDRSSMS